MIENLAETKKQLTELATVLNAFKSEAVQLRLLEMILDDRTSKTPDADEVSKKPAKRPNGRKASSKENEGPKPTSQTPAKRRQVASGAGAVATITQLLDGDFFKKPRVINDLIIHCKDNLARTFKANEFSGKLGQLVRTNQLTRVKNTDNQYEYKKP